MEIAQFAIQKYGVIKSGSNIRGTGSRGTTTVNCLRSFTVHADVDAGVPSRILDVFAAHGIMPTSFSFNCTSGEMALHVDASSLTETQIGTFWGKFIQISGVRRVSSPSS